jgi:hypothetical protein
MIYIPFLSSIEKKMLFLIVLLLACLLFLYYQYYYVIQPLKQRLNQQPPTSPEISEVPTVEIEAWTTFGDKQYVSWCFTPHGDRHAYKTEVDSGEATRARIGELLHERGLVVPHYFMTEQQRNG